MTGSRRRTRDNIGMDLFPFMAVLICTMGALIMLLVVMVQQARVRAKDTVVAVAVDPTMEQQARIAAKMAAQQAAEHQAAVDQALATQQQILAEHDAKKSLAAEKQQEIEDLRWQAEVLRPSYDKTVEDLAAQRLALSHIEQHTRELEDRANKMQAEADLIAATSKQSSTVVTDAKEKLERINAQIASAKEEVEAQRKELKNRSPKYALIPYDGPSGTNRPPVYIECLVDRVILQPENVQLIGEDFREPLTNANPLAMALRAKREFMLKHGLLAAGSEPYPLLVVRPGAASSYAAARSAMKAWEAEFGYELVEADIELDYKPADSRLKTLLEDTVIEARGRRRLMLSRRPQVSSQPEMLRPSSTGGFETVSNGTSPYAGRSNGGNSDRNNNSDPFGNGGAGNAFDGNAANGSGGTGKEAGQGSNSDGQIRFRDPANQTGNRFENAGNFQPGNFQSGNFQSGGSGSSRQGDAFDPNMPLPPDGINANNNSTFQNNSDQFGPSKFGETLRNGPGGDSANGRDDVTVTGGGGGSSTQASGSGGQGASGNGGSGQKNQSASGQSSQNDAQYQSLAQSRGNGWALPNASASAVGIKRPIEVVCTAEQLLLIPEKGSREELRIFRHAGSIPAVIDPFVDAVHKRIQDWGIAGQGIFWRPLLQVQIQGNADGKYRQLLQLLDRSGIEVTREP